MIACKPVLLYTKTFPYLFLNLLTLSIYLEIMIKLLFLDFNLCPW